MYFHIKNVFSYQKCISHIKHVFLISNMYFSHQKMYFSHQKMYFHIKNCIFRMALENPEINEKYNYPGMCPTHRYKGSQKGILRLREISKQHPATTYTYKGRAKKGNHERLALDESTLEWIKTYKILFQCSNLVMFEVVAAAALDLPTDVVKADKRQ